MCYITPSGKNSTGFDFFNYVTVKIYVVGRAYGFGVIAMLAYATEIIWLTVKSEMHSVHGKSSHTELFFKDRVTAGYFESIKLRIFGAPKFKLIGVK